MSIAARLRPAARIGRNTDGFTAVEFAMVIGPFLALLFAIMEVALVYFATFSLENATEQASRLIRTGQAQGFSAADFLSAEDPFSAQRDGRWHCIRNKGSGGEFDGEGGTRPDREGSEQLPRQIGYELHAQ